MCISGPQKCAFPTRNVLVARNNIYLDKLKIYKKKL